MPAMFFKNRRDVAFEVDLITDRRDRLKTERASGEEQYVIREIHRGVVFS